MYSLTTRASTYQRLRCLHRKWRDVLRKSQVLVVTWSPDVSVWMYRSLLSHVVCPCSWNCLTAPSSWRFKSPPGGSEIPVCLVREGMSTKKHHPAQFFPQCPKPQSPLVVWLNSNWFYMTSTKLGYLNSKLLVRSKVFVRHWAEAVLMPGDVSERVGPSPAMWAR